MTTQARFDAGYDLHAFQPVRHGMAFLFPVSDDGRAWTADNVAAPDWQCVSDPLAREGKAIAFDCTGFLSDIVEGAEDSGLSVLIGMPA